MARATERAGAPLSLSLVLAGFVVICGVVLLLVGGDQGCQPPGEDPRQEAATQEKLVRQQVRRAQRSLSRAGASMAGANYGAAQKAMTAASQELELLMRQLPGGKNGNP